MDAPPGWMDAWYLQPSIHTSSHLYIHPAIYTYVHSSIHTSIHPLLSRQAFQNFSFLLVFIHPSISINSGFSNFSIFPSISSGIHPYIQRQAFQKVLFLLVKVWRNYMRRWRFGWMATFHTFSINHRLRTIKQKPQDLPGFTATPAHSTRYYRKPIFQP